MREQAVFSTDPEGLSERIDAVAYTLGGATQWIPDQQQLLWRMEDLVPNLRPWRPSPPRPGEADVSRRRQLDLPLGDEMRDLFRSGPVAEFLLHGNIFDVVPPAGGKLSLKAFLKRRCSRATTPCSTTTAAGACGRRGAATTGAAGCNRRSATRSPISSTREPGVALELIDRYLLRTLNLAAIKRAPEAPPGQRRRARSRSSSTSPSSWFRGATRRSSAALQRQRGEGPGLGQRSGDPPGQHRHRAADRGAARPERAGGRESPRGRAPLPLPSETEMLEYLNALAPTQLPDLPAKSEVPMDTLARRMTGLSRVGARRCWRWRSGSGQRITAAGRRR